MLPVLVAAVVLTSPSTLTLDASLRHGGEEAGVHAEAGPGGLFAEARNPLGPQYADVRGRCVPDWNGACDTLADCAPGTLNCWVSRAPRDDVGCVRKPDGSYTCYRNGTGPAPPEPEPSPTEPVDAALAGAECGAVLAPGPCQALPRPGEPPAQSCARLLAPAACAVAPPAPDLPAACRGAGVRERACRALVG